MNGGNCTYFIVHILPSFFFNQSQNILKFKIVYLESRYPESDVVGMGTGGTGRLMKPIRPTNATDTLDTYTIETFRIPQMIPIHLLPILLLPIDRD